MKIDFSEHNETLEIFRKSSPDCWSDVTIDTDTAEGDETALWQAVQAMCKESDDVVDYGCDTSRGVWIETAGGRYDLAWEGDDAEDGETDQYEIRIPNWGVFHSKTLAGAQKRAKAEQRKAARACNGPAPHAAIFLGKNRVDYIQG